MLVYVLDRILNGNDVAVTVLVAIADHCRQRGRFARAGAADQNNQSALGHDHIFQHLRQIEVFELRNRRGNGTHDQADAAHLHKSVDTKTTDAGWRDGKVTFFGRLKFCGLFVGHDRARNLARMYGRQTRLRHRGHLAVDFHRGREAGGNEEIRPLLGDHRPEQLVYEL